MNESDHVIVGKFAIEYRGVVQYYLMASDVFRLHRLRWVMETSMLRTLARKHGSTVSKMAARFKAKIQTPYGPLTCFEARMPRDNRKELVARFGGIPLKRQKTAELTDRLTGSVYPHKELIRRLQGNRCEICERAGEVEVHHIRSLNDLSRRDGPSPDWMNLMARRRRKGPRGLRRLSRAHPHREAEHGAHTVVTGEPDARKSGPSGSVGARAEKALPSRDPRRSADPTRTLLDAWAYAQPYRTETERRDAYPAWLHTYNHHRGHTALKGQPPASRVPNLTGQYT
ncbi:hypothetical protein GCM10010350_83770 [Streptomyces galilaeus]|nr:hypothetical protein GCM10010350_83770 [Streptomyces galilaeus]